MGRLLMTRGTVFTEKHIKICKMWGIVEAQIEGISGEEINAIALKNFDPAEIAIASELVHKRFCHADMDHPAIRELIRLCILQTVSKKINYSSQLAHASFHKEKITEVQKKKCVNINPLDFIDGDTKLSTLPDIYNQLIDAISKPSCSTYDIENVISKDTNFTARLLKIVNSALYGYPSRIDTLSRAVNIIGTRQLCTLALGVNVITIFNKIPSNIINMEMFWKHSILCGICARILAGYKNIQNTERLFIAGLLHDIGRLVYYNYLPKESVCIAVKAKNENKLLYLAEHEVFGMDHSKIGGRLLIKWQMPLSLEDMVRNHHKPQKSKNQIESSILHLADIMANAMDMGTSGEKFIPPLNKEAWIRLGMSPNVLSLTMEQAGAQLTDVFKILYGDEQIR
jgi:HD-like signal output (HDOD) protein